MKTTLKFLEPELFPRLCRNIKFNSILLIFICQLFPLLISAQSSGDTEWITEFEKSGFKSSPDYKSTMAYFKRIADESDYAEMFSFGKSPQNRDLNCLIVSRQKYFTYDDVKNSGIPVVLFMSGIHSGEINGKDATMLLLREILITQEKIGLIDNAVLLVIPIFNVDGHERRSPYNRINQVGPEEMGWRVTAQNYNLNRDFMKADAPEMQAFLKLYSRWLPDFFVDIHSTDGSDHQYQTTITIENKQNTRSVIADWVNNEFYPFIFESVERKGYTISPFVGFVEGDPKKGIRDWAASPRFSNGYAAIQNKAGLLIESHVLKTYEERVFSTKAVLESVLELINSDPAKIKNLSIEADNEGMQKYASGAEQYPLALERLTESDTFDFKGIEYEMRQSDVAGGEVKVFTGEGFEQTVPYLNKYRISESVKLPLAYIIPEEWKQLADIMKLHGIEINQINEDSEYKVEQYTFSNVTFATRPYEGRFIPAYEIESQVFNTVVQSGSYLVNINQRTYGIIAHLLEPLSSESFVKWGAMNQIFERKEYFENYAMLPIAEEMYKNDPLLKEEFDKKVESDEEFKKSVKERLDFFYMRSPYYDSKHNVYPVLRVLERVK